MCYCTENRRRRHTFRDIETQVGPALYRNRLQVCALLCSSNISSPTALITTFTRYVHNNPPPLRLVRQDVPRECRSFRHRITKLMPFSTADTHVHIYRHCNIPPITRVFVYGENGSVCWKPADPLVVLHASCCFRVVLRSRGRAGKQHSSQQSRRGKEQKQAKTEVQVYVVPHAQFFRSGSQDSRAFIQSYM